MQETWYADDCDLIKWAALVHLAKQEHVKSILQVVFWTVRGVRPQIQLNKQAIPLSGEVWSHFRDLRSIVRLGSSAGVSIEVLAQPVQSLQEVRNPSARERFFARLESRCEMLKRPIIVFLDPDTGVEPLKSNANAKHVLAEELLRVFSKLREEDWLVLYQHQRHDSNWRERTRGQFAEALQVDERKVLTFSSTKVRRVVLHATKKSLEP